MNSERAANQPNGEMVGRTPEGSTVYEDGVPLKNTPSPRKGWRGTDVAIYLTNFGFGRFSRGFIGFQIDSWRIRRLSKDDEVPGTEFGNDDRYRSRSLRVMD
jgi:hypothetical protein